MIRQASAGSSVNAEQLGVLLRDHAIGDQAVAYPVDHRPPELAADEDHREGPDLVGLHEHERLEEFIKRAEPARGDDERVGVADEADLAREEVVEVQREVEVVVGRLLERQLDVEPDRQRAGVLRSAVGRLHATGATARDDLHALCPQATADLPRELVVRIAVGHARRSEHRYSARHRAQRRERVVELGAYAVEPLDLGELRLDQQALGSDDLLIGRLGRA